jgi:hypothetical protein
MMMKTVVRQSIDWTLFPSSKLHLTLVLAVLLSSLAAPVADASEESFLDEIKAVAHQFDNRSVPLDQYVVEDTVLAKTNSQAGPFRVLARKKRIERYKCSNCHGDKPITVNEAMELTHGDIVLEHGRGLAGLTCIDCHHPEERDYLEDKKGRLIDFDHSYQLCGQCHFRQKRDWLGGAHGKRVTNWAGDRVVYTCTTCHNPHSPKFAKRYPATYSVPLD